MEVLMEGAVQVPEHLRFPASVRDMASGHTWRKTAVVIRDGKFTFAERVGAAPEATVVMADAEVAEVWRLMNRSVLVRLLDGSEWLIGKGDGCSCGSPLKRWYSQQFRP